MKFVNVISVLIICFFILSFNTTEHKSVKLTDFNTSYCDDTPELNKQVVDFVTANLKKKVGKGECWDLAAGALNLIGAKWNGAYVYGDVVRYKTECVYPGDIIHFNGVKVTYEVDNRIYTEIMDQHTAIIYKVEGKGDYIIAHQNTAFSGRKVGLSPLNLEDITKGRFTIYRPVK